MADRIQQELQRGALINTLGVLGKIAGPSFLILVTRLYGPDAFGIFITATALVEMGLAFLTAGFKDGALISVARHADYEDEQSRLYQLLANTLGWSLFFAAVLIVLTYLLGPWMLPALYDYGERLLHMLEWMCLALPLLAFDRIVIAATQGLKIMKYDAFVNGGTRPVLLLAMAVGWWFLLPTEQGLAAAYVTTQAVVGGMALWIYSRELAWRPLVRAFRAFEIDREMLAFALPQNLNMTLERFITNIDIIMLGMFGVSAATTGFYGAGAMIVRELQNIKQVFSNAFAPHIVRLYRQQDSRQLSASFSMTSRWITTLAIPALLAVAVLRSDLLRLVHPDFASEQALFMLLLLPIPYLQCGFGLAGNIVVMTGHSRLNLLNSSTTGVTNALLNWWLIPLFGPVGAAAASALASVLKATLEVVEARYVARARLLWSEIYKPHVAGLVAAGVLAFILLYVPDAHASFGQRLLLLLGVAALYAGTLVALLGRLPRLPAPLRSTSP